MEIENASGDELVADLHAAGTIARAIGNAAPQAGKPRTAPRIAEEHPEKPAVAAPGATCIGLHEMQSQTSRKLEIRPPVMTGMTFGCDVIVNGQHIKAGTVVRFADPAAERKDLSELLWKLYEGLYGHRQAEGIDPFRTAVNGALEVKKAWDKL